MRRGQHSSTAAQGPCVPLPRGVTSATSSSTVIFSRPLLLITSAAASTKGRLEVPEEGPLEAAELRSCSWPPTFAVRLEFVSPAAFHQALLEQLLQPDGGRCCASATTCRIDAPRRAPILLPRLYQLLLNGGSHLGIPLPAFGLRPAPTRGAHAVTTGVNACASQPQLRSPPRSQWRWQATHSAIAMALASL